MSDSKVLFLISGSISAYKAADVVSKLIQKNFEVQVVFSPSAERFVGKMTFEGLTGKPVLQDIFENGQAMAHIHLARWADLFVLCPASAQKMSELASGSASDLISALFLAKEPHVPALIFPAMNTVMWAHPFVQRNKTLLQSLPSVKVVEPAQGSLACGEVGEGRLPEPGEILKEIETTLFKKGRAPSRKILITGGGTSEPIDSVRSVTNTSSGETAGRLAEHFARQGHHVDLVFSRNARYATTVSPKATFLTHRDLSEQLKTLLAENSYDAVIHLAAVSDFSPQATSGKISSKKDSLVVEMTQTPKIIGSLREWSKNKKAQILGFKLSVKADMDSRKEMAHHLIQKNSLDGVVSNDLQDITENSHSGFLLKTNDDMEPFESKEKMFQVIERFLEERK